MIVQVTAKNLKPNKIVEKHSTLIVRNLVVLERKHIISNTFKNVL